MKDKKRNTRRWTRLKTGTGPCHGEGGIEQNLATLAILSLLDHQTAYNPDEVDFIINYDTKCRMGQDDGDDE
jgi:hypothetical protein